MYIIDTYIYVYALTSVHDRSATFGLSNAGQFSIIGLLLLLLLGRAVYSSNVMNGVTEELYSIAACTENEGREKGKKFTGYLFWKCTYLPPARSQT